MVNRFLRGFIIFGILYFLFEACLHFSNFKLASTFDVWSPTAVAYAKLINYIYASFVLLVAIFLFEIQKDLKKYKTLIVLSSFWAIFHGVVLLFLVWSQNYQEIFQSLPSALVYLPFYREYISFNSLLLFVYTFVVYIWARRKS